MLSYARGHKRFRFSDVIERESDRLDIVVSFLAVLELMKMGRIYLVQENMFDDMQIETLNTDDIGKEEIKEDTGEDTEENSENIEVDI